MITWRVVFAVFAAVYWAVVRFFLGFFKSPQFAALLVSWIVFCIVKPWYLLGGVITIVYCVILTWFTIILPRP